MRTISKGRCHYEMFCIYQPPNAHVGISRILLRNAMAAAAVKKIYNALFLYFRSFVICDVKRIFSMEKRKKKNTFLLKIRYEAWRLLIPPSRRPL
jgi:hypothetical protein